MKVFLASGSIFQKRWVLPNQGILILVVVGMCCVLSCLEAGFLLIVGVGGGEPHECAVLVEGHR